MNKDQVREDVTPWPSELCFCCLPKSLLFFSWNKGTMLWKSGCQIL